MKQEIKKEQMTRSDPSPEDHTKCPKGLGLIRGMKEIIYRETIDNHTNDRFQFFTMVLI